MFVSVSLCLCVWPCLRLCLALSCPTTIPCNAEHSGFLRSFTIGALAVPLSAEDGSKLGQASSLNTTGALKVNRLAQWHSPPLLPGSLVHPFALHPSTHSLPSCSAPPATHE